MAKYEFMLSESIPGLCYSCHADQEKEFTEGLHVHTAIKQGKCTGCHDPHASDNEYLQRKTDQDLCYSCHEQEALDHQRGKIHPPVKEGGCFLCHEPHVSDFRSRLIDSPEKLCAGCHDIEEAKLKKAHNQYPISLSNCILCHSAHSSEIKDPALADLAKGLMLPYVHTPFGKKMCDSCHSDDPDNPLKLRAPQVELCYRCHSKLKGEVDSAAHIHTPAKEGPCTGCHVPHASKYDNLLKATGKDLCADCHPDVMKKLEATYAHTPAVQGECLKCHKPHSSEHGPLLVSESISLCESCHPKQITFTHPIGEGVIDPRTEGEGKEEEIVTCVSCHDSHGEEFEFIMLQDKDGELCFWCHKVGGER